MPQNVEIPEPVASVATDKQIVIGPDKRRYVFSSKISPERVNKYFIKQGWELKEGKWFTKNGEPAEDLVHVPSQVPSTKAPYGIPGAYRTGTSDISTIKKMPNQVSDYGASALPSFGGIVGGIFGATPGAAIGGAGGQALKEMFQRLDFATIGQPESVRKDIMDIGIEAVKQGTLEKVGQKTGDLFFKGLSKIPHATIKNGIPLLPGDLAPNSKVMRYVEDLLTNLAPSAKTMAEFESKQSKAIIDNASSIADGFAKFNGTPEEMGVLLQKTLRDSQKNIEKGLAQLEKSYIQKGATAKQAKTYVTQTKAYKDYVERYENELVSKIVGTNKPELIAGLLRGSKSALNENRILNKTLTELSPELLGKVRNTLTKDIVNEMAFGSKDPAIRSLNRGMGRKLADIINDIGDQKLKAVFGDKGYQSLTEFSNLIKHVDRTSGNGTGKFLNLIFVLPFRSGTSMKAGLRTASLGFVFNRAAKIITNPDGIKIYENYIRAIASNSPKLINLARDEMIKYNERSDREYDLEQFEAQQEFTKEHGGMKKQ